MNRRTFLKSIAATCGTAVVCPGELLKSPVKHLWMRGKDGGCIEGERICMIDHPVFIKARQQGCTDSILYGIPY